MSAEEKSWKIFRTCHDCGHADELPVTKREAAFDLVNSVISRKYCVNCKSTSFSTGGTKPEIDAELLKEWAADNRLSFLSQDEELMLAQGDYLDIILETLDSNPRSAYKRNVLVEALCIIVYDNSSPENSKQGKQLKERVIAELNKRPEHLQRAEKSIMDYIKKAVFPQLEISKSRPGKKRSR